MTDCGHDLRDTDCPTCLATLAADPYDRADLDSVAGFSSRIQYVDSVAAIFAELDVPFTDGSNS